MQVHRTHCSLHCPFKTDLDLDLCGSNLLTYLGNSLVGGNPKNFLNILSITEQNSKSLKKSSERSCLLF